jgi:hypothetical protein
MDPFRVDGAAAHVIQAPGLESRIMRHELSDYDRHQTDAAKQAAWRSARK